MPKPRDGETRKDFVDRCVPIVIDEGTAKDGKQAVAVCNSMWEQDKKKGLAEFSFTIKKASLDPETGEMRWRADTSDTEIDSYGDKMSLSLYEDFLSRIEKSEAPPEEFTSDYWSGGMPYLSISHYPDLNGAGVPGEVSDLYIDGSYLKAKGTFFDTPLGKKCWEAVKSDFKNGAENKVRISIAFLDLQHKHLSNDYVFERSMDEEEKYGFCIECLKEMVSGEYGGLEYQKGSLIHLALTRVPVNKRTLMEVDKSMTTRKEDAESIVEELAEDLEEQAASINKALVIKAEDEASEDVILNLSERLDGIEKSLMEIRSLLEKEEVVEEEEIIIPVVEQPEEEIVEETKSDLTELAELLVPAFDGINSKLELLTTAITQQSKDRRQTGIPERRSIDPQTVSEQLGLPPLDRSKPTSIRELAMRSVMGR